MVKPDQTNTSQDLAYKSILYSAHQKPRGNSNLRLKV